MSSSKAEPATALIARLRGDGKSYHAIAALLNQRGYPATRGGRWYGNSVRQVLEDAPRKRTANRPLPPIESPDQALFDVWHACSRLWAAQQAGAAA
jgi:hypothetical protein